MYRDLAAYLPGISGRGEVVEIETFHGHGGLPLQLACYRVCLNVRAYDPSELDPYLRHGHLTALPRL